MYQRCPINQIYLQGRQTRKGDMRFVKSRCTNVVKVGKCDLQIMPKQPITQNLQIFGKQTLLSF